MGTGFQPLGDSGHVQRTPLKKNPGTFEGRYQLLRCLGRTSISPP